MESGEDKVRQRRIKRRITKEVRELSKERAKRRQTKKNGDAVRKEGK